MKERNDIELTEEDDAILTDVWAEVARKIDSRTPEDWARIKEREEQRRKQKAYFDLEKGFVTYETEFPPFAYNEDGSLTDEWQAIKDRKDKKKK